MLGLKPDHEIHVFIASGARVHFTLREMRGLFRSWQFWVMVLVGFAVMTTGHPATLPQFDNFWVRLSFWTISLLLYLVLAEPYMYLVSKVWQPKADRPIPLLLMSAPYIMFVTHATGAGLTLIFEPGRPLFDVMTWEMNLRNLFVAHVFETASACWLIPAQRERRRLQTMKVTPRTVALAGRQVELDGILRVKAAEHHLEIHTPSGVEILRERMATFLEQVGPSDGVQTHRSHWVAAAQVGGLDGMQLRLRNGEVVPIARGRLNDVRAWVDDGDHGTPSELAAE